MYSFENVIANCVLKKNVKENILQIGKNTAYSEKKDKQNKTVRSYADTAFKTTIYK